MPLRLGFKLKFSGNSYPVLFQQTAIFPYGSHISKRGFKKILCI